MMMEVKENKNPDIEIREIQRPEEAHQCAELMANSEPWITLRRTYDESVRMLSDPSREVYVAVAEGEVVGFTILHMKGAFVGYIQTVGVKPGWRKRGIGSRLIEYAEDRILAETPNVFICASSFNSGAQRLYKRLGYQVIGELRDYIVVGHSEILMRKTIAPLTEYTPHPKKGN